MQGVVLITIWWPPNHYQHEDLCREQSGGHQIFTYVKDGDKDLVTTKSFRLGLCGHP
jgi:hypothetical protein